MAIPFLNNITLNNNEIQNVRLQNAGSPPLNSGPGQIYFDTSAGDETAKYYSNITDTWVSLKEYSFPAVTPANGYITSTITGTFPKPIITFDLNAVDGTASANERYLTQSNTWAEVSGISGTTYDLEGVGSTNGTAGIRLKGSDATNDDVSIIGAGTTTVTRSSNILTVTSNDQFDGTVTDVSASTTGTALDVTVTSPTIAPDLDFTWAGTASQYVNGEGDLKDVALIPGTYEWDIAGDSGSGTVGSGDTINFVGGTNVTTAYSGTTLTINSTDQFQGTLTGITEGPGITVTPSATSPTVAVDYLGADNYLLEAGAATVAGSDDIINFSDDTDSNVKKTTLGTIPVESLTLVKNYIDSSASGGVYYQGGYNPTTDTTSPGGYGLQTPPNPNIIEIGWMYTATADGTFFGEQLRVGDVLIAEIDAPTSLSDWTTVQNNIDLATDIVVGLGNVVPGSSNTVTAPYSSGTATLDVVDSTPSQKGAVIVDAGTGISVSYASGTATVTNTDTNTSNTATGTITAGSLSGTVNHTFGINTIVQTISSSGDTVFCDVTRTTTGGVGTASTSVATIAAAEATDITILVQKIG